MGNSLISSGQVDVKIEPQSTSSLNWRVVSASVMGLSHEKAGLPCQDAHLWTVLSDGVLAIAVADGAGSASMAEVGAEIAARTAIEALAGKKGILAPFASAQAPLLLTDVLRVAQQAVEAEATARNTPSRELASTLIVVLAAPDVVAVAQVGDGAVVIHGSDGRMFALTRPPDAEYANETTFLVMPEAVETAQYVVRECSVGQVAVFSDGLQRLALQMPSGRPHDPFFVPLFRFAASATENVESSQQLVSFLKSPRISERADDDLTLVLATPVW